MKKIFVNFVFILLALCFWAGSAQARENVTDWYIKDFNSQITVNKDSSLDIVEKIIADCGEAVNKHGIFRIVPEVINISGQKVKTPVELISITDFDGQPINYSESKNWGDNTVTWKIGDPDITVQGENYYQIHYVVKNAIRFNNPDFDELYWNLSGNFWDLEIDNFNASLVFPDEVNKEKSEVNLYSGDLREKGNELAVLHWSTPNIMNINSIKALSERQGITASITFPENIFTPHKFGFWELYGNYFYFLIPLIAFFVCFILWKKYGDDPNLNKTIIAEYDIPGNLSPIELGTLKSNGKFNNKFITAEIINLAVKRFITIMEVESKVLFITSKDYDLINNKTNEIEGALNVGQKLIFDKLFSINDSVRLSSLKDSFFLVIKDVQSWVILSLKEKKLIAGVGLKLQVAFFIIGIVLPSVGLALFSFSFFAPVSFGLSGIIIFIFGFFMPKRTLAGAELNWKIKGFELFMKTVDKDRAKFYEEENIFEKFLPYAIIFGMTKEWIKRMKDIYGEEYFNNYSPVWYAGNIGSFNADSFASTINNLSSSISSNVSGPSGSGGGGSSGGGGGGGGGGGW